MVCANSPSLLKRLKQEELLEPIGSSLGKITSLIPKKETDVGTAVYICNPNSWEMESKKIKNLSPILFFFFFFCF